MNLIQENNFYIIDELLKSNFVSPNKIRQEDFFTPCALACECGNLETVKVLYKYGAKLNIHSPHFIPPLHAAIRGRQQHIVQWLMNEKIDSNCWSGGYYLNRMKVIKINSISLATMLNELKVQSMLFETKVDFSQIVEISIENKKFCITTEEFIKSYASLNAAACFS